MNRLARWVVFYLIASTPMSATRPGGLVVVGPGAGGVQDAWITQRLGTGWGENPLNLVAADQDPNLVYATDFGRTLLSCVHHNLWRECLHGEVTTTPAVLDIDTPEMAPHP